ncbi:MAG: hypothetical protein ACREIC_04580, partial [Limisphaerales bacterium]
LNSMHLNTTKAAISGVTTTGGRSKWEPIMQKIEHGFALKTHARKYAKKSILSHSISSDKTGRQSTPKCESNPSPKT